MYLTYQKLPPNYHRAGYRLVTDSAFLEKKEEKIEMGTPRHEARGKICNKIIGMIRFWYREAKKITFEKSNKI